MLSFSFSIPRPVTCFHSLTKNFTSLHSVSVFRSQGPLHVFIVWQKTSLRCAQFQFFSPKAHYMFSQYDQKPHFAALSFSFSIPRPVTCFHSLIKNFTSLCSVSVFQSQGLLHVFIVWQKTSLCYAQFQFFYSQGLLHVFIVWQKTSLCCAQFQFFNPKASYMFS